MKPLILSVTVNFLIGFVIGASAFAATAPRTNDELLAQAQAAYAARGFSNPGVQQAQTAADLYGQLVAQTSDDTLRARYLCSQSQAVFFVGSAATVKETQAANHLLGMNLAIQAAQLMGIADVKTVTDTDVANLRATLSLDDLHVLGEALYFRGLNLRHLGLANGALDSLNKWPELRDNMNLIVNLGLKDIHEFGAYRILGRGYDKVPTVLGGDLKKAEKYLLTAIQGTFVQGQMYSMNGYNNLFYAEALKDDGMIPAAKLMLQNFIRANAAAINPAAVPETQRAQAEAQDLLNKM